jgi:hypothetical protein
MGRGRSTALAVPVCPLVLGVLLGVPRTAAQTDVVSTYSSQELTRIADGLPDQTDKLKESGIQEKRLSNSPMLAFRNRDGKAELHEQFTDVVVVPEGNASLIIGGTVVNPGVSAQAK